MAIIYLISSLIIILSNYDQIPAAFSSIFTGAFSPEGVTGGFMGVLILGFRRAVFSNEAGIGSAPIAHAAVKTDYSGKIYSPLRFHFCKEQESLVSL